MTRKLGRRLPLAIVLLSALAMVGSNVPTVYALPAYSSTMDFYSDSDFANWIGVKVVDCNGSVTRVGNTYGGYSRVESLDHCGAGGQIRWCYQLVAGRWTQYGC